MYYTGMIASKNTADMQSSATFLRKSDSSARKNAAAPSLIFLWFSSSETSENVTRYSLGLLDSNQCMYESKSYALSNFAKPQKW